MPRPTLSSNFKPRSSVLRKKYGYFWPADIDDLTMELTCVRAGGRWVFKGESCGEGLAFHHQRVVDMLWPELDNHRWHDLSLKSMTESRITVLLGPGSCVAGHTRILDPVTGNQPTIQEICDAGIRPTVMTVNGPRLAGVPFLKGKSELVEVVLKSGEKFTSTPEHLVLTEFGFRAVSSLQIGQFLLSYASVHHQSISEPSQSIRISSALNSLRTEQDCKFDYPSCLCFGDEQLLQVSKTFQDCFPSQFGAPERIVPNLVLHMDAKGHEQGRIRLYPEACRLSNLDALNQNFRKGNGLLLRAFSETPLHAFGSSELISQFLSKSILAVPSEESNPCSFHNLMDDETPCGQYRVQADAVQEIRCVGFGNYYDLQVPEDHHYFSEGAIHHNSGKTHEAAKYALVEYFASSENTTILISSTDLRGLELRIWGEIKKLWQMAKNRHEDLPGHLIDSKHCISTDNLQEDEIRDLRNGIIGIPCIVGQRFIGLGKYVGIKNKHVRLIADEAQFLQSSFLESFSNLEKNPDFKAVILGNPLDPMDSLGKAAEPKDGWGSVGEPNKTTTWKTKFKDGICVNLVGTDSPNFDFPQDQPPKYPYLICQSSIDSTVSFYGKHSQQYFTQCVGIMKTGLISRRVINRELCKQFHAFDSVIWATTKRTRIYAIDAAYGNIGGDRCVGVKVEFGKDINSRIVFEIGIPTIIPVTYQAGGAQSEDQIALYVKSECEQLGITPDCVFFDATGRGSLGTAFARLWSAEVNPVEFGGNPTTRPVCQDIFIVDEKTKSRRLKLCTEHYSKFVTELWFSVRYAIESSQLRNLPEEVMEEGCQREWKIVKGNKIEIETKAEMKVRTGRSPDLFDAVAVGLEGARRKGFMISKLANEQINTSREWMKDLERRSRALASAGRLNYSV